MRLVVLMIEVEQPEGISARKLVLETAKHNVLTAYNAAVGLDLLKRFPAVDVAIVHTQMEDVKFEDLVKQLRKIRSDLPIIALSPTGSRAMADVNYIVSSHDPQALLRLLADRYEASKDI